MSKGERAGVGVIRKRGWLSKQIIKGKVKWWGLLKNQPGQKTTSMEDRGGERSDGGKRGLH